MAENPVYRLLERPWLFRLQRAVLAPGTERGFERKISSVLQQLPPAQRILDVGCGPASWLFRVGLHPVGADMSWSYIREYTRGGAAGVVGSASALPFPAARFDGIWSIGLLHHLSDAVAARAVGEMVRVCAPGGYVVVLDAVMPKRAWRRPLAYAVRRLDRGRFVRSEDGLRALFPNELSWHHDRFTFAASGLEALLSCGRIQ